MALFRSLRHPRFALLWSGQTLSRIGDFLYEIALAWWVLEKTGSALAMSTVLIFSFAPMLLFLLVGGVAVDRLPRLRLMLAADLVRGVIMLVVCGLAVSSQLEIWEILLASLLFGVADAFFQPAYTALVPQVTPREDWPSANSLSSMSAQIGRIAGPGLGATIVGVSGVSLAFGINALSFFLSAILLLPLLKGDSLPAKTADARGDAKPAQSSILKDVREGLSTVLAHPVLWLSILTFAITNMTLTGPYSVSMPFLVSDFMGKDVDTLGLLYTIFPIGYVIGGVWLGRKARIRWRGITAFVGVFLAGLGLAVFGLPLPLFALGIAALVNGAALEVGSLIWANLLQEIVPSEKLGRVASIDMLGSFVLIPVGFGIAGWATELIGPAPVFLIGGGITMLVSLLVLLHPAMRKLD